MDQQLLFISKQDSSPVAAIDVQYIETSPTPSSPLSSSSSLDSLHDSHHNLTTNNVVPTDRNSQLKLPQRLISSNPSINLKQEEVGVESKSNQQNRSALNLGELESQADIVAPIRSSHSDTNLMERFRRVNFRFGNLVGSRKCSTQKKRLKTNNNGTDKASSSSLSLTIENDETKPNVAVVVTANDETLSRSEISVDEITHNNVLVSDERSSVQCSPNCENAKSSTHLNILANPSNDYLLHSSRDNDASTHSRHSGQVVLPASSSSKSTKHCKLEQRAPHRNRQSNRTKLSSQRSSTAPKSCDHSLKKIWLYPINFINCCMTRTDSVPDLPCSLDTQSTAASHAAVPLASTSANNDASVIFSADVADESDLVVVVNRRAESTSPSDSFGLVEVDVVDDENDDRNVELFNMLDEMMIVASNNDEDLRLRPTNNRSYLPPQQRIQAPFVSTTQQALAMRRERAFFQQLFLPENADSPQLPWRIGVELLAANNADEETRAIQEIRRILRADNRQQSAAAGYPILSSFVGQSAATSASNNSNNNNNNNDANRDRLLPSLNYPINFGGMWTTHADHNNRTGAEIADDGPMANNNNNNSNNGQYESSQNDPPHNDGNINGTISNNRGSNSSINLNAILPYPPPALFRSPQHHHQWQMHLSNPYSHHHRASGSYVHTQIDYINCLVPDLTAISNCSFYWGKMDRYEAERLLDGKPEGTFLLRDSAQEDHIFSVSFRRFDRSLHARIEQWKHRFSFDSHDPGVYSSDTVTGLIEHYKDPSHCMFFEPMLTRPLNRNFVFNLQHLARTAICDHISYDTVNELPIPNVLKSFLKEYHYRQKVRTKHFDSYYQQ